MKKLLSTMLSLCIMGTSIFTVPFTSHGSITQSNGEANYKGMVFKMYSDHAELTDYHLETYSELTIPSSIYGTPVTTICSYAFEYAPYLKQIIIPDTVTQICEDAFFECWDLQSVTILNPQTYIYPSVSTICNEEENGYPKDTTLDLNYTYQGSIYGYADSTAEEYANNFNKNFVAIDESTVYETEIVTQEFEIYNVDDTGSCTTISHCFTGLYGDIELPETYHGYNIEKIGDNAFSRCSDITSITVPATYKYIGKDAFYYKGLLRSITIMNPDIIFDENTIEVNHDVTINGYRNSTAQAYAEKYDFRFAALDDDSTQTTTSTVTTTAEISTSSLEYELYNFDVTGSCPTISYCFTGLYGDIELPETYHGVKIEKIGDNAFRKCSDITSITVPATYKYIGKDAFYYKGLLRSITILNPDIVFDDNTIKVNHDVTINGYRNSTAQAYAEKYGFQFAALDDISTQTTTSTVTTIPEISTGSLEYELYHVDVTVSCPTISYCFTGLYGDVELPETYHGVKIEKIGDNAFRKCSDISTITVPATYKYIGKDAFYYKGLLRSITILNPDIVFDDNTIEVDHDVTIYGYRNSTAQAYAEKYGLKFRALEDPFLKGDANLDDNVNIADAVLVMQVATNPDRYSKFRSKISITSRGEALADVDGKPGLSNTDALQIQKYKLGLIKSFDR